MNKSAFELIRNTPGWIETCIEEAEAGIRAIEAVNPHNPRMLADLGNLRACLRQAHQKVDNMVKSSLSKPALVAEARRVAVAGAVRVEARNPALDPPEPMQPRNGHHPPNNHPPQGAEAPVAAVEGAELVEVLLRGLGLSPNART
jgi:hypothetical protein